VAGGYDVAVVASPAGLAPGTFQASLQISCPGAAGSPVSVPVELTVAGSAPILTVAPASLSFAARSGTNPAEQVVTLGNGGTGALALPGVAVSYASGSSWLQTSVTGRQTPYALHVQPIVSGLAQGTYSATVQVQSLGAANSPATIAVTLLVCDPPALQVYWTPSPAPPQAGFQVPGLVAAGFPAQLACNEAGVAGVQVFVGTPLSVVPCTGTGNCVDASTWRCDLAGGGVSVPLASGGTYDVEVRGLDARGNEKYSGQEVLAVRGPGRRQRRLQKPDVPRPRFAPVAVHLIWVEGERLVQGEEDGATPSLHSASRMNVPA